MASAQSELSIIDLIRSYSIVEADQLLSDSKSARNKSMLFLKFQTDLLKNFDVNALENQFRLHLENADKSNLFDNFYYHISKGDLYFYNNTNKDLEAISSYKNALSLALVEGDKILICEALKKILYTHRVSFLVDNNTYQEYLNMYREYYYDELELVYLNYYDLNFKFKNFYVDDWDKDLEHYLLNKTNDTIVPDYFKGKIKQLVGFYYEMNGSYGKSKSMYKEAINHFNRSNFAYSEYDKKTTLIYQAILEINQNNSQEGIRILGLSQTDRKDKLFTLNRMYIDYWKSVAYYKLKNYKSAFESNVSYEYLRDSLNEFKYSTLLTELETKYQTAEKEKQILEEKQKAQITRNWLIAATIALVFGAGIAILVQKNTTKKRKLAEQETLLKQERVDNLLKQQELVSIDAMIEGQEKERQRVANELHDDLGSLMATIKLHFSNVKGKDKDPALKQAQSLLEEAYQKVRGIAHSKNSGVMSSQGLLPAVKKMAQVISETNALEVNVEDFGMGERMENSLELSLFRTIQELVANAIKHAEATKLNIQISQYDDNLNIIIEDNGKGFDRSNLEKSKTGMGLTNIEKRIEHLEGNFTIDSVLGKGTSIIIDIPV
ncbi:sensor histidine kinase [Maribacter litoralis]|uniref:sensor histidine kinase n=1 Tax=Maribacter litoralis TaxID=2059726 RepID=UPI000E310E4C|nr:sensor histidine kinase [Maribacter litoralis]